MKQTKHRALKNVVMGLATATLLSSCADVKVSSAGLNQLQHGYTSQNDHRTKAINNVGVGNEDGKVIYHGLNQIENVDANTYFGKHRIRFDTGNVVSPAVRIITNNHGHVDTKYGVHVKNPTKVFGSDFGWLYVTANDAEVDIQGLAGEKLTENLSAYLMQSTAIAHKGGKPKHYTEAELNYGLTKSTSAFLRYELHDFDIDHKKNELIGGVAYQFKF